MKKLLGKIIIFLILGVFALGLNFTMAQDNKNSDSQNDNAASDISSADDNLNQAADAINSNGNTNADNTNSPAADISPDDQNSPEIQAINQQIQANKDKIDSLNKTTSEYSQKIEDYKSQAVNLKNELGLLDNLIVKVGLDAQTLQLQIDKAKLQILSYDFQIKLKQEQIEKNRQNLTEYIRQIAQNDQKSYLDILITNNSFADFFSQLNYLEQIQSDMQSTIDHLKLLKDAVTVQKSDQKLQMNELTKLQDDLQSKQSKLAAEQNTKEQVLLDAKTSELKFQRMLQQAKEQQLQIGSEITTLQQQLKNKTDKLKKAGTTAQSTLFNWPVPSHIITTYFHDPDYPFRYLFEHPAIDIRAKQGTPIQAPADGYVARVHDGGYGYSYIILIHDNGISTVYGHVSAIYCQEDNYVKAGDIIGLTGGMPGTRGAGPLTIGPHLHFEVRLNGIPVNPLEYLP